MAGLLILEEVAHRLSLLVQFGIIVALLEHLHVFGIVLDIAWQFVGVVVLVFVVVVGALRVDCHAGLPFGKVWLQDFSKCLLR